ncbi:MAG: hypothetical protein ACR2PT_11560 [Endozoicomonas sp.]
MTNIETRKLFYKKQQYWFSPEPFDVQNCSAVYFYAVPNRVELTGFSRQPSPTLLIDLRQSTDDILKNMKKSCRYEVNKASRSNLVIARNQNHQRFFEVYRQFVSDKGYSTDMSTYWPVAERGTLYTCSQDGALIAGLMTLEDSSTSRWLISGSTRLSGSSRESRALSAIANRALVWEAILDARTRGKLWFDFGGYYDGEDRAHPEYGIASFKRSFGGEEVMQYKYSRVYSNWLLPLKKLKARLKDKAQVS